MYRFQGSGGNEYDFDVRVMLVFGGQVLMCTIICFVCVVLVFGGCGTRIMFLVSSCDDGGVLFFGDGGCDSGVDLGVDFGMGGFIVDCGVCEQFIML